MWNYVDIACDIYLALYEIETFIRDTYFLNFFLQMQR